MTYVKTALKLSGLAFAIFLCVMAFGLSFSVYTALPAHAGAPRVSVPETPNPVTPAMQSALTAKFSTFMSCIGPRLNDVRGDLAALEAANNAAGWAAANRDLAAWNAQAAIVDTELARLKPKYGC